MRLLVCTFDGDVPVNEHAQVTHPETSITAPAFTHAAARTPFDIDIDILDRALERALLSRFIDRAYYPEQL